MAAKKTTAKKKTTTDSYNSALIQMQKLSNASEKEIQKMVNEANSAQMKFNANEAQKARDWQKQMSSTAHQMEVKDLKKAGLNPVLSANNGATSYTTSSASATPESGASALSGMAGSVLGALGNMESSRLTSQANMRAAKTNAVAMQRSAEISAEAQRDAANRAARAQEYSATMNYKSTKYRTDAWSSQQELNRKNQRWLLTNQTVNSWAGFMDKTLRNFGAYNAMKKGQKSFIKTVTQDELGLRRHKTLNSSKGEKIYFSNKGKITESNFKLSAEGNRSVGYSLSNLGVQDCKANRELYIKAVKFGNDKAMKKLLYGTSKSYANIWNVRAGNR